MITLISAKVKMVRLYKCSTCNYVETGTTERVELRAESLDDMMDTLKARKQSSHYMPLGWSYSGVFKCPKCSIWVVKT